MSAADSSQVTHPQPDFEAVGVKRWHTADGAVVADTTTRTRGVYLYRSANNTHRKLADPDTFIAAIAAARDAVLAVNPAGLKE